MRGVAEPAYPHEVLAVVLAVRDGRLTALLWRRGERRTPAGGPCPAASLRRGAARHGGRPPPRPKVDVQEIAHLEQLETRSDPERDPRGGCSRPLTSGWSRPTPSPTCPTTPPGTRSTTAAHRIRPRLDRRVGSGPAAGQAVLHDDRLRPGSDDLHHLAAARHLSALRSGTRCQRPTCSACCCDARC